MKKIIAKRLSLALLFTLTISAAFADKGTHQVTGKVVDINSHKPIEYATVYLVALPDSTIMLSSTTDSAGSYRFASVNNGSFVVRAQFVGYKTALSSTFRTAPVTSIPDIALTPTTMFKEITVVGKRPFIEKKVDRTVLNIESSPTASGENAYEVLKKAPNINIDKDDNININGKAGVTVLINDRPTNLSGTDLANYLKGLQGGEIEKVEIISAPPARYDAAGNTGVINVKTKRVLNPGINGSINAGMTYNGKLGGSGGVNLNFRSGRTNIYATYNPASYAGSNTNNIERKITFENNAVYLNQPSSSPWRFNANNFKAGMDFDINKRNTVGVMVSGYSNIQRQEINGYTFFTSKSAAQDSSIQSFNKTQNTYNSIRYNLNYRSVLDTSGKILNVDVDYGTYDNGGTANNSTLYFNGNNTESHPALYLRSTSPADITIKSGKIDYEHPFNKQLKMEVGAKGSLVRTDNDLRYEKMEGSQWQNDHNRSNHFIYDENIMAGYISLSYDFKNTSIKGGLRGENTWSKGNSITEKKVVTRSYFDLFPTLFIQQRINEQNSLGLSYNYRIDRARYDELNPFRMYLDEYTYVVGNPFLRPQYTHNIAINYTWKSIFFTELTYTHTKDVIVQIVEQNDTTKIGYQTNKNLSALNGLSWVNNLSLNPTQWFRTTNNLTLIYNNYRKVDNVSQENNGKATLRFNSVNSFMLPKGYTVELMGYYSSPQAYGMFKISEMYAFNLGFQKSFLDNKAKVKISFDDIFNTLKNKGIAKYDNIDIVTHNKWKSQRVGISFTYRFGKSDLKPSRNRASGLEEEQSRVGAGKN